VSSDVAADNTVYRFLALCARAESDAAHYSRLAQAAAKVTEWESVAAQAESHGLAPLLYVHAQAAEVQLPPAVKRKLQGLYLRHRHANQVRTGVLRDILSAYAAAGIPALVLKGAALCRTVYPEPGLRPMSDLDILVREGDLWRAQSLLTGLGFDAPLPAGPAVAHRHLAIAARQVEGLSVQVEIHHKLLSDYFDHAASFIHSLARPLSAPPGRPAPAGASRILEADLTGLGKPVRSHWVGLEGLTAPPHPFDLAGLTAYTLSYEDTLEYLCRHLSSHVNVWDFGRLIWVADIVSLAERYAAEIDWEHVRQHYPAALNTLSLLHFVAPLSDGLLSRAAISLGHAPQGIGVEFQGWPKIQLERWREKGYRHILRDTLFPSEWWLRLRYRVGSARSVLRYRWVRHPLHILGHVVRAVLEWLGWPTPQVLARGGRH
jgi:hypothetical protein